MSQNPQSITSGHSYLLVRFLFVRLLGLVYFLAFVSLGLQILGLVGSEGILPAKLFLEEIKREYGARGYWLLPTLFWINAGDSFLRLVCFTGGFFSLLVVFGLAPAFLLAVLWAVYLSLTIVGQVFLGFQWDALLLEVGFVGIFFAERHLRPVRAFDTKPLPLILWVLRFILFKLMFSSGLVKLMSGDMVWRNLTALSFHYMTQPLPNNISWYVYQWPLWFHKISTMVMFVIELIFPFFIFLGRRMRLIAFWGFFFFQVLIILTGNYCFFNLLTMILCLTLLDDQRIKRLFPERLARKAEAASEGSHSLFEKIITGFVGCLVVCVSLSHFIAFNPVTRMAEWVAPFRTINPYGLFAVMTTQRPEIIIEGSRDGREWMAYEFKWKPGSLDHPPSWVMPHQPRVDWQMWFAALGTWRHNPWIVNFIKQLLKGSKPVLDLLASNPFKDRPPQYIRALLYKYDFTSADERKQTGHWWKRTLVGLYCPVLTIR